jgi:hypothetical protein
VIHSFRKGSPQGLLFLSALRTVEHLFPFIYNENGKYSKKEEAGYEFHG